MYIFKKCENTNLKIRKKAFCIKKFLDAHKNLPPSIYNNHKENQFDLFVNTFIVYQFYIFIFNFLIKKKILIT